MNVSHTSTLQWVQSCFLCTHTQSLITNLNMHRYYVDINYDWLIILYIHMLIHITVGFHSTNCYFSVNNCILSCLPLVILMYMKYIPYLLLPFKSHVQKRWTKNNKEVQSHAKVEAKCAVTSLRHHRVLRQYIHHSYHHHPLKSCPPSTHSTGCLVYTLLPMLR